MITALRYITDTSALFYHFVTVRLSEVFSLFGAEGIVKRSRGGAFYAIEEYTEGRRNDTGAQCSD